MAQFARPISDIASGTWTASSGSDLYAMLDESSASDTDYIELTGSAAVGADSLCRLGLTALSNPGVDTGHVFRLRARKSASGGDTVSLTWNLIDNSAGVVTDDTFELTDSWQTFTHNIDAADIAAITDYSTLSFYLFKSATYDRNIQVSWAELEIPDAGSGAGLHRLINGNLVNFGLLNNGLIT